MALKQALPSLLLSQSLVLESFAEFDGIVKRGALFSNYFSKPHVSVSSHLKFFLLHVYHFSTTQKKCTAEVTQDH